MRYCIARPRVLGRLKMSGYQKPVAVVQRGYTMVELTAVMVIIGILAAVAMPRYFDRGTFESREFHDQVISTLRYAQKAAIAQHRFVCVAFTVNSIALSYGSNSDCSVGQGILTSPSGDPYPLTSTQSVFNPVPTSLSFDCLGRPNSMGLATGACGNTLAVLTASRTIQVSNADAITIEAETGYVH